MDWLSIGYRQLQCSNSNEEGGSKMTKKELINHLKNWPEEAEVVINLITPDKKSTWHEIDGVELPPFLEDEFSYHCLINVEM